MRAPCPLPVALARPTELLSTTSQIHQFFHRTLLALHKHHADKDLSCRSNWSQFYRRTPSHVTQFAPHGAVLSRLHQSIPVVADPDLELRGGGGGGGGGLDLLALLAFIPSVISAFLPKIRGAGPPGPSPRSVTACTIRYQQAS